MLNSLPSHSNRAFERDYEQLKMQRGLKKKKDNRGEFEDDEDEDEGLVYDSGEEVFEPFNMEHDLKNGFINDSGEYVRREKASRLSLLSSLLHH